MLSYYQKNVLKGEIVAMICAQEIESLEETVVLDKLKLLKNNGFSDKDAAKAVSLLLGCNKNKAYKLIVKED